MTDSESEIERCSSIRSAPECFDIVPETMEFKLKFFGNQCSKAGTKISFPLKEGRDLPYHTKTLTKKGKVLHISFSKFLVPSVTGFVGKKEKDWWIFMAEGDKDNEYDSSDKRQDEDTSAKAVSSTEVIPVRAVSSSSPLSAPTCSPSSFSGIGSQSPPRSPSLPREPMLPDTPVSRLNPVFSPINHKFPNWLSDLKKNFKEEIVDPCSAKVREAVENDVYIEDDKEFLRIRHELVNSVMSKLKRVYGGAAYKPPGKPLMMVMVTNLSYEYPNMFRECEAEVGKRRIDSIGRQASLMCDRYREQIKREKQAAKATGDHEDISDDGNEDLEPARKKKKKDIYGVISSKYHSKIKVSTQARMRLSLASEQEDFNQREEIFSKHRPELCVEFRSGKKNPDQICRGFWKDPRHLSFQFEYETESPALDKNVENNLRTFLGHLETYLFDVDNSVETRQDLRDIELVCETEMQGNTLLRDLHILKLASEHFDNGASAQMFRISDDNFGGGVGVGDDPSPYILAVMVEKTFVFELYMDRSKLLGNMNFVTAIAAFFHLSFIMDLKYPKQSETLGDLLQRRVCKYGDESGTRTWKRKDTADKKYQFFCSRVFKLTN